MTKTAHAAEMTLNSEETSQAGLQAARSPFGNIFEPAGTRVLNTVALAFLKAFALMCNTLPPMKKSMRDNGQWINYKVGAATKDGRLSLTLSFEDGKVTVRPGVAPDHSALLVFHDLAAVKRILDNDPMNLFDLITRNRVILDGDRAALLFVNYLFNKLQAPFNTPKFWMLKHKERKKREREYGKNPKDVSRALGRDMADRKNVRINGNHVKDPGVRHLPDPFLSALSLDSFPRIKTIYERQRDATPEISVERPWIMTRWFRENGFETDQSGATWHPGLRQALAFHHLMATKKPVIQTGNLLAGSLAPEEVCVMLYPDTEPTLSLWQELDTIDKRVMNPHVITKKNRQILKDLLPFWRKRNIHSWIIDHYGNTTPFRIDGRFAVYYNLKKATFSHTIPNIEIVLAKGTTGIKSDIDARIKLGGLDARQKDTLKAMRITLDGLKAYAQNLAREAESLADREPDPERREELLALATICAHAPENPARTLHEAMNAAWIYLVGVLMENNNISMSPGRLDQIFQPYFERDMETITDPVEKEAYIQRAVELSACLFLRISHHYMAAPDLVNYLYSGTQTDSAVTLGGVTRTGGDAVNDMTYIFLKVTEMLGNQEPNVNVRFHPGVNSDDFLKRVCEVNYITSGTPSVHNDKAVFKAMKNQDFTPEDLRDWGAVGCVEPAIPGKHTSHTNALCMNLIAGLEMVLNNGYHPLLDWRLGPETGRPENGDFTSFDQFFDAYLSQMRFLVDCHCHLNTLCCEAHSHLRPQPFLSATTVGCIGKAMDNTEGGALYNSSGGFNAGLADVTDSMMAVKKLVFDEKRITFADFKQAIDGNFENHPELLSLIRTKVPLFGSGNDEAVAMANRLTREIHGLYAPHRNFRGGKYFTGYWTVSWHSGFGSLTGAIPSGRLSGKAFTPGLTPQPHASDSILDNMRDVARLEPEFMENNIAFNVKFVPTAKDTREKIVDTIFSYLKTYFGLGGMQAQLNMVDSETLKDAMAHPENYKNLIVRISGYNARFVELSRDLQIELVERSQFTG